MKHPGMEVVGSHLSSGVGIFEGNDKKNVGDADTCQTEEVCPLAGVCPLIERIERMPAVEGDSYGPVMQN